MQATTNWLDEVMTEQGRLNVWLAQQIKVSESKVSRWRRGVNPVPDEIAPVIRRVLGLDS